MGSMWHCGGTLSNQLSTYVSTYVQYTATQALLATHARPRSNTVLSFFHCTALKQQRHRLNCKLNSMKCSQTIGLRLDLFDKQSMGGFVCL